MVSAAAGALAPVGFKHLGAYTAASILIWKIRLLSARSFASPLAGACEKTKKCPHGRRRLCAATAAGRPSASMGGGGTSVATAAGRPSASMGGGGLSAATAAGSVPRLRRVVLLRAWAAAERDCGGSSFCEHGRRRAERRDCGGSSVCEHGRLRYQCRNCGGASVCEHARLRPHCRDCAGASICQHRRQRVHCRDCTNFVCQIQGCPRQDLPFAGAPSLLRHMQTMHGDNPRAVTKSKELEVHQALRSPFSTNTTCPSAAAGWGRRRSTGTEQRAASAPTDKRDRAVPGCALPCLAPRQWIYADPPYIFHAGLPSTVDGLDTPLEVDTKIANGALGLATEAFVAAQLASRDASISALPQGAKADTTLLASYATNAALSASETALQSALDAILADLAALQLPGGGVVNAPAWAGFTTWELVHGSNVVRNLHLEAPLSAALTNGDDTLSITADCYSVTAADAALAAALLAYYTSAQVDALLVDYRTGTAQDAETTSAISAALLAYYTSAQVDADYRTASAQDTQTQAAIAGAAGLPDGPGPGRVHDQPDHLGAGGVPLGRRPGHGDGRRASQPRLRCSATTPSRRWTASWPASSESLLQPLIAVRFPDDGGADEVVAAIGNQILGPADVSLAKRVQRGPGHAHRGRSERGRLHPDPGSEPLEHRAHQQLDPRPRAPLRLPFGSASNFVVHMSEADVYDPLYGSFVGAGARPRCTSQCLRTGLRSCTSGRTSRRRAWPTRRQERHPGGPATRRRSRRDLLMKHEFLDGGADDVTLATLGHGHERRRVDVTSSGTVSAPQLFASNTLTVTNTSDFADDLILTKNWAGWGKVQQQRGTPELWLLDNQSARVFLGRDGGAHQCELIMISDEALVQTKSLSTQLSLSLVIAATWSATPASPTCRTAGSRRSGQAGPLGCGGAERPRPHRLQPEHSREDQVRLAVMDVCIREAAVEAVLNKNAKAVGQATKRATQELVADDKNFVVTNNLGSEFATPIATYGARGPQTRVVERPL